MNFKRVLLCTFFIGAISVLLKSSAFSNDYYVKNGGKNVNDGLTDATAWATIAKVNDFAAQKGFSDGDTINLKRGSTWADDETLGKSGTSIIWGKINGLTIQDYGSGAKPKISGTKKQPIDFNGGGTVRALTLRNIDVSGTGWCTISTSSGQIKIYNVTDVTIDGIYCDGHAGTTVWDTLESGLQFDKIFGSVEIKNCELFNLVSKDGPEGYDKDDRQGIVFWSYNPKNEGNLNIHHNIIHHVDADCIQLGAIQTDISINNNTFHHFGENAVDLKNCKDVTIENNEMYRGDYAPGGGGTGDIDPAVIVIHKFDKENWAGTVSQDIHIRGNYLHDSAYKGVTVGDSEAVNIYNNYFQDIRTAICIPDVNGLYVYNNIICLQHNIPCVGDYCSGIRVFKSADVDNVKITKNKIFIDNTSHYSGLVWRAVTGQNGNVIENNIIYITRNTSNTYPLCIYDDDGRDNYPTVKDNSFYNPNHTNRTLLDGKINYLFSGSIFSDPLFTDAAARNFALAASSPCFFLRSDSLNSLDGLAVTGPSATDLPPAPSSLKISNISNP